MLVSPKTSRSPKLDPQEVAQYHPALQRRDSIFERGISQPPFQLLPPTRRSSRVLMSLPRASLPMCTKMPSHHSAEDFIAPCLDSTTEILTNPNIDMDKVNIVYGEEKPKRGRQRSRSYIFSSLMSAFQRLGQAEQEGDSEASEAEERECTRTINFFSFADMRNSEVEAEARVPRVGTL